MSRFPDSTSIADVDEINRRQAKKDESHTFWVVLNKQEQFCRRMDSRPAPMIVEHILSATTFYYETDALDWKRRLNGGEGIDHDKGFRIQKIHAKFVR